MGVTWNLAGKYAQAKYADDKITFFAIWQSERQIVHMEMFQMERAQKRDENFAITWC